jgi:hypothetical protein
MLHIKRVVAQLSEDQASKHAFIYKNKQRSIPTPSAPLNFIFNASSSARKNFETLREHFPVMSLEIKRTHRIGKSPEANVHQ